MAIHTMNLKVGDKVIILNKTRGENLNYTYSDGHKWKKGDTAYIYRVFLESYALTPHENHLNSIRNYGYGTFNPSDIKKVEEPKFKVGDKVEVLGKKYGQSLLSTGTKVGEICTIQRVFKSTLSCSDLRRAVIESPAYHLKNKIQGHFFNGDLKLVEEKEMKYKAGNKTLVVEPLKGQMTKGSTPSHAENNSFLTTMIRDFNYSYGDGIPINDKFIEYIEQHKYFIEWLLVNDFIEKVIEPFKPFYITLKINSAEEYWTLWHRLNVHLTDGTTLEEYLGRKRLFNGDNLANRQNLWDTVDNHKKKVKEHYSPNENNAK